MSLVAHRARPDQLSDALALVAAMFVDLGTSDIPESWRHDAEQALLGRAGTDAATFVTLDGDRVVAVAVGLIELRLPSPRRPDGRIGHVEWLATAEGERRRGAARLAMEALMAWFGEQGVRVVDVHASAAAGPLYRSLSFTEPQSSALRRIM